MGQFRANAAIPLTGASNFRSLGGYATPHGPVREGEFYRADALCGLNDADIERVLALGIRSVVDLRDPEEMRSRESSFAAMPGVTYVNAPLLDGIHTGGGLPASLLSLYISLVDNMQSRMRFALQAMIRAPRGVVFHCSAGKDRTGILSALLLSVAGVCDEQIIADYAATYGNMRQRFAREFPTSEAVVPLLKSEPETMQGFLTHIRARYGGAKRYMAHIGIAEGDVDALYGRLV